MMRSFSLFLFYFNFLPFYFHSFALAYPSRRRDLLFRRECQALAERHDLLS